MAINFKYNGSIKDVMPIVKEYLEGKNYDIIHYAPEAGYILTDYKLYNINTGTSYEINFDIQNAVISWCNSNTEIECKKIIDTLNYESGIFIGEFVKAILKINNIANEIGRAAEITNKIHLLEKINKIPELTLKYVATNQSIYI